MNFDKRAFLDAAELNLNDGLDIPFVLPLLRTNSLPVGHYTAGDTFGGADKPLPCQPLAELPSKISRRYSPINRDNVLSAAMPPEPMFYKDEDNSDRISMPKKRYKSVEEALAANEDLTGPAFKQQMLQPGIDFARTPGHAAELLRRLGKPLTREVRLSEGATKDSSSDNQETARTIRSQKSLQSPNNQEVLQSSSDRIFLKPGGNDENLHNQAIEQTAANQEAAHSLDSRGFLRPAQNQKNLQSARMNIPSQEAQKIFARKVLNAPQPQAAKVIVKNDNSLQDIPVSNQVAHSAVNIFMQEDNGFELKQAPSTANLSDVTEERLNITPTFGQRSNSPLIITGPEDAVVALKAERGRFEDVVQEQHTERQMQLRAAENRLRGEIAEYIAPVVEILEEDEDFAQIRGIVQQVIQEQQVIVRTQNAETENSMTEAMREVLIRQEIANELQSKFDEQIYENNKMQEAKVRDMITQVIERLLNP